MPEYVSLNGHIVPSEEARISIYDHGFLYGNGLFETMRVYGGKPFRLERHLMRMEAGAHVLRMDLPEREMLRKAVQETIEANGFPDASLRLTVTRGIGKGPSPSACHKPTVLAFVRPSPSLTEEARDRGYRVIVSLHRRDEDSPLSGVKSLNYLPSMLAKSEAEAAGVEEAIFLNRRGCLAEGSTSNLFWVSGGVLYTPSKDCGILPGIVREDVLKIANAQDIKVSEGAFSLEALEEAEEAFLTNSSIEIMPLTRIGATPIGPSNPGPVTRVIQEGYREMVESES